MSSDTTTTIRSRLSADEIDFFGREGYLVPREPVFPRPGFRT